MPWAAGVSKPRLVEGKPVDNILLDTGCSRTLVNQSLVPKEKLQAGEAVAIRCAHGDTVLYPLAQVDLDIDGQPLEVQAAVSDRSSLTSVPAFQMLFCVCPAFPSEHGIVRAVRQIVPFLVTVKAFNVFEVPLRLV